MRNNRSQIFRNVVSRTLMCSGFLLLLGCPSLVLAQNSRVGGAATSGRFMETIDPDEGRLRIERFRNQRLDGDFRFAFVLEHLPRRDKTVRYTGTLWGSWNDAGAINRFELDPVPGEFSDPITYIIQGGREPMVWMRQGRDSSFRTVEGADMFEPIIPGIVYTPFDLLMPFIYWENFEYTGPERERSRVAQQFLMYPPVDSIYAARGIEAVRLGLDDDYDTLLTIEIIGPDAEPISEFTVDRWVKVDGRYIVKQITLKDLNTRDRTRFIVEDAAVGLRLEDARFIPVPSEGRSVPYGPQMPE